MTEKRNGAYILPDGNVQIAFSAGRSSAKMLYKIIKANGGGLPDRVKVIMTNTGREMPESLRFAQECGKRWGVDITLLEYCAGLDGNKQTHSFKEVTFETANMTGQPMIDVASYFGYLPNRAGDFCSHELKTRTARRYCVDVLGWERWTVALGMRSDEKSRIATKPNSERWSPWYPMNNAKETKRTVSDFWRSQPFDLELQNINGVTPMGNCDGCFKKSEWKRAVLAREHPDRAQWWADMEARFGGTFKEADPWAQKIDFIKRQGDWVFDTENDALCQADDGDCM